MKLNEIVTMICRVQNGPYSKKKRNNGFCHWLHSLCHFYWFMFITWDQESSFRPLKPCQLRARTGHVWSYERVAEKTSWLTAVYLVSNDRKNLHFLCDLQEPERFWSARLEQKWMTLQTSLLEWDKKRDLELPALEVGSK